MSTESVLIGRKMFIFFYFVKSADPWLIGWPWPYCRGLRKWLTDLLFVHKICNYFLFIYGTNWNYRFKPNMMMLTSKVIYIYFPGRMNICTIVPFHFIRFMFCPSHSRHCMSLCLWVWIPEFQWSGFLLCCHHSLAWMFTLDKCNYL